LNYKICANIINNYTNMPFKPTTKEELQTAVNLYCNNKYEGINMV